MGVSAGSGGTGAGVLSVTTATSFLARFGFLLGLAPSPPSASSPPAAPSPSALASFLGLACCFFVLAAGFAGEPPSSPSSCTACSGIDRAQWTQCTCQHQLDTSSWPQQPSPFPSPSFADRA